MSPVFNQAEPGPQLIWTVLGCCIYMKLTVLSKRKLWKVVKDGAGNSEGQPGNSRRYDRGYPFEGGNQSKAFLS